MQSYFDTKSSFFPPYDALEKRWLKSRWGSEYDFLMSCQLSIHYEADREEGRRIARTLIAADRKWQGALAVAPPESG